VCLIIFALGCGLLLFLMELLLLRNREITVNGLKVLVQLFTLGLIVCGFSWRWLRPDFGLNSGVGFGCAGLGLVYGLVGLV